MESVSPSAHLTDVSLHTLLVSHLRKTNKSLSRNGVRRSAERTRRGGHHRTLHQEVPCPSFSFKRQGVTYDWILSVTTGPRDSPDHSVHGTAGPGTCVLPEKLVVPEVLISVRLTPDSLGRIDVDDWAKWLLSMPGCGDGINVEGREVPTIESIYQSHSTLLLIRMPLETWNLLPRDKSMSFIGYIYGENYAAKFNRDVRASMAALQQADHKDASRLGCPAYCLHMDRAAKGFPELDTEMQPKIAMPQPLWIHHGQRGHTQPPAVQSTLKRDESKLHISIMPRQSRSPSIEELYGRS